MIRRIQISMAVATAVVAAMAGGEVAGAEAPALLTAAAARRTFAAAPGMPPGASQTAQAAVRVTSAWVREPVPGRTMAAAYAVLENTGASDCQIVAASAEVAGTVELHEMVRSGDMMKMAPVKAIALPAGSTIELKPGGLHLMLFDLKRALKEGETVTLTFTLDNGATIRGTAPVKRGVTP